MSEKCMVFTLESPFCSRAYEDERTLLFSSMYDSEEEALEDIRRSDNRDVYTYVIAKGMRFVTDEEKERSNND